MILHTQHYTIRTIGNVQEDAFKAVCEAVERAFNYLRLPAHLFITAIDTTVIQVGDGWGFGVYHEGMQTVAVSAGDEPDELTRQEWLEQIKIGTIHEVVHYWQDINGVLDGSEESEKEAEELANSIMEYV